jgi:transcriptional regulator
MFIPKNFQQADTGEVHEFIQQNGFGVLISQAEGKLWGSHIPLMLSEDGSKLHGHVSKANKQWRDLASSEVMVIFNGPHAYISSSWYDHENVPTWNYIAVHVYGTVQLVEGERLRESLKELVDKYEQYSANPVSVETMSPQYLERETKGLVGFEISITRIEAAYKLSQNRDKKNHDAIVNELEKRNDPQSIQVAEAMKATCPHLKNT